MQPIILAWQWLVNNKIIMSNEDTGGTKSRETDRKNGRSGALPVAFWIFLFALFFAVIIWDAFFSNSGILRVWKLEQDLISIQEENVSLSQQLEEMQEELGLLRSRPELLEEVAREKLQMARPEEEVYLFPEEPVKDK